MMLNFLKGVMLLGGLGLMVLLGILLVFSNRAKTSELLIKKKTKKIDFDAFKSWLYLQLTQGVLTKRYIGDIRERLVITTNLTEEMLRQRVVSIFLISFMAVMILSITFLSLTQEPFLIAVFFIALYFMSETIIEYFVDSIRNKLIRQQIMYNEMLRVKFYENKMIDDALYATNIHFHEEQHEEIVNQGLQIHEIIDSSNAEKEALKYYDTAPNKYLKLLTGIALITKEYGDRRIKGASLFMNSMTYLNNEIRLEVEKRERLNIALKSLNIIVVLPLFFMRPIKAWAVSNFYPLEKFYTSQMGFIFEMIMLGILFLSYIALRKIQQVEEEFVPQRKKQWSQIVYSRFQKILKPFVPQLGSKSAKRYVKLSRDTASYEKIEHFYTRKLGLGLLAMLLVSTVLFMAMHITTKSIYTAPTTDRGFMSGSLSKKERIIAQETTQIDNEYLLALKHHSIDTEALYARLMSDQNYSQEMAQLAADRIREKYQTLKSQRFMWFHLLIMIAGYLLGYSIPNMEAFLKKQMIKIELEHELSQFQSIITLLMHIEHITVLDILEWMERFSSIFKEPIQLALLNYDSGAFETLEVLKKTTSYHDFQKLIEKMQSACDGLSIVQAFDDLDSEKLYYQERKKRMNEELVKRKVNLGQVVGFFPAYSFLVIYLMIPMLWSSMMEMQAYFGTLNGF